MMFEHADKPRVFGLAPGVDFPRALVDGLVARLEGKPPQDYAQVELIVSTRRMAKRVRAQFDEGKPRLLPRIRMLSDIGEVFGAGVTPPPVPPLRRRLELVQLVSAFLDNAPDFAPRTALFDLAESLADLLAEMQGEGVDPAVLETLETYDQSGHWARTRAFVSIVQHYFDMSQAQPDEEARQRHVIEELARRWRSEPPDHPVIVAGSTGSRGATRLLLEAVAHLPQGAVVLPGFDSAMPGEIWSALSDPLGSEDHPQFRFVALMNALGIRPADIAPWHDTPPPNTSRNALVSLALRPAPVTDGWLRDGPKLESLDAATADVTLLEAPAPRHEALAIALRLRKAVEDGETAALVTPDRTLARQVAAALDRWHILPDDSAGKPLPLSPTGRLLRHVAALFERQLTAESLLTLLKHPLTHKASDRGDHLRFTREFELHLRRHGLPFPDGATVRSWAARRKVRDADAWADWVANTFCACALPGLAGFEERLHAHLQLAAEVVRGSNADAEASLWQGEDGQEAQRIVDALREAADAAGALSAFDYANLFNSVLAAGEVRAVETARPDIRIWGTREARVQGADLLILAGLNEGTWPEPPPPDPWLNRSMRHAAGLLLPERRIGLSAHDFQQAVAAPKVWLSRSLRSDEAETVPSRWLNRITNLLGGLVSFGGDVALESMRARGRHWLDLASEFEKVAQDTKASRPSPCPPASARPSELPVTAIRRLIRDPYAIYARYILDLRPLQPIMRIPDALIRGVVTHKVMEHFIRDTIEVPQRLTRDHFLDVARTTLEADVPWPSARLLWLSRIERVADAFIDDERTRRETARPMGLEVRGRFVMAAPEFTLTCQADRIDRTTTGGLRIYDYKTGRPPTQPQQKKFDKQLLLETLVAEKCGFDEIAAAPVERAAYIGLGAAPGEVAAPIGTEPTEEVEAHLRALIAAYSSPQRGYLSRRAIFQSSEIGDYDHLARFGEWDVSDKPNPEVVE